ncbi:MAG: SH3 domain-containing protein [Caldilineaceae bacterium]|nr:SH3 domain-containing protein [Caldilineaceae bacterium]
MTQLHSKRWLIIALTLSLLFLIQPAAVAALTQSAHAPTARSLHAQANEPVYALQGVLGRAERQHFDTYMITSDGRAYALAGETPELEGQITTLRNQGPNTLVKVWGTLYPQGRLSATPEIVVASILVAEAEPTATPAPTTQPQATVRNASINVRSGPSTDYTPVNVLQQGQTCTIIGRNSDNTWWQLDCGSGTQGWVLGQLVDVAGNTGPVPVVNVAPPPPQPTPVPTTPVYYGWKASYWNNPDLSGNPVQTADVAEVNFDWGNGGPAGQADNFSTRFERTINFNPGTYRFVARADDGVRVFVDNQIMIDQWHVGSASVDYTADRSMYGNQMVRVEHYEGTGLASLRFSFFPLANTTIDGGGSGEWEASYFGNPDLSGNPLLVRREPRSPYPLDWDWGAGSPAPGVIGDDNWSARWRGRFFFDQGDYRFQARSDDGVRLYIDGIRVIDGWADGYKEPSNQFLAIGRGDHEITIEFYERGGLAFNRVWWYRTSGGGGGGGDTSMGGRDQ